MANSIYRMSNESLAIFDKYWRNREFSTTPEFYNKMDLIQKDLIQLHYKNMDTDSKIRSQDSLRILNERIDKYARNHPPKVEILDEPLTDDEVDKVINVIDNLLKEENSPLETEPKSKSTRPRGKGGRNTKVVSDVP